MCYRGSISANGKTATVSYMPGWGDPGNWYINLGDEDEYNIPLMPNPDVDQREFLTHIASEKYVREIFANDWKEVGDEGDVIRICLEYTGYNAVNRVEDEELIAKIEKMIKDVTLKVQEYVSVTADLDLAELVRIAGEANKAVNDLKDAIRQTCKVTDVYDAIQTGEKVGLGWDNQTFLRDFPDTPEAELIIQVVSESE